MRHLSDAAPIGPATSVQSGLRAVDRIVQHEETIRLAGIEYPFRVIRRAGMFEAHWHCRCCDDRGVTRRKPSVESALEAAHEAIGMHNVRRHCRGVCHV